MSSLFAYVPVLSKKTGLTWESFSISLPALVALLKAIHIAIGVAIPSAQGDKITKTDKEFISAVLISVLRAKNVKVTNEIKITMEQNCGKDANSQDWESDKKKHKTETYKADLLFVTIEH